MSLLTNQIIFHQDLAGLFSDERRLTPYERKQGFAWYLCPAEVAAQQVWLLVNDEFGYVELVQDSDSDVSAIEQAVLAAIEYHWPDEQDNVSVSLDPNEITWHLSDKIPNHVGLRYQQALLLLFECLDIDAAHDALEQLNNRPWTVSGLTPSQGLEGLLLELA